MPAAACGRVTPGAAFAAVWIWDGRPTSAAIGTVFHQEGTPVNREVRVACCCVGPEILRGTLLTAVLRANRRQPTTPLSAGGAIR